MNLDHLALSIVSHGQGDLVRPLLQELAPWAAAGAEIIVTLNRPEDESFLRDLPFAITILRNNEPKGFGANHNQAFARTRASRFAILNPDIRLLQVDLVRLLECLEDAGIGASAPVVVGPSGEPEDSARRYPTVGRIARRVGNRLRGLRNRSDYDIGQRGSLVVEWVAGMFVIFRRDAFEAVRGFDESYFMYLEDADICRRLSRQGLATVLVNTRVMHDARRATMKSAKHLRWHARSMLRFLVRG